MCVCFIDTHTRVCMYLYNNIQNIAYILQTEEESERGVFLKDVFQIIWISFCVSEDFTKKLTHIVYTSRRRPVPHCALSIWTCFHCV